jgi:hypothetical protein
MSLNLKPSDAFRVSTVEYNFTITLRGLTLLSVLTSDLPNAEGVAMLPQKMKLVMGYSSKVN